MLRSKRKPDETFVDHMTRATRIVRGLMCRWGYECTFTRVLRAYFGIAGSCAKAMEDPLCSMQILPAVLNFKSQAWFETCQIIASDTSVTGSWRHSRVGRPKTCWETALCKVFGANWYEKSGDAWWSLFEAFKRAVYKWVGRSSVELKHKKKQIVSSFSAKIGRDLLPLAISWQTSGKRVIFCSDSRTVVGWVNGTMKICNTAYRTACGSLQDYWHWLNVAKTCLPAADCTDYALHVYREHNKKADALAAKGHGADVDVKIRPTDYTYYRVWSVGSHRSGSLSIGVLIQGAYADPALDNSWSTVAELCGVVEATSVTMTELIGLMAAATLFQGVISHKPTLPPPSLHDCVSVLRHGML